MIDRTDRAALTSAYEIRWFAAGDLSSSAAQGTSPAGWYVTRLDGGPVPAAVKEALAALIAADGRPSPSTGDEGFCGY